MRAPNPPSAAPRRRAPRPENRAVEAPPEPQGEGSFVCRAVELEFEHIAGTDMFQVLNAVRASTASKTPKARTLAEARGYSDDDLFGLAEIGHAYFKSGGLRLAQVIFEGLAATKPNEAYFHLSLGLVRDYLGDKAGAKSSYERAAQLAPRDPHADLNLAELCLETADLRGAQALLVRAAHKAAASGQEAVEKKARALHAIASRRIARRRG